VDLSPDLLEMAKTRVEGLGLGDLVVCVEADILTAYDKNGKPAQGLDLPPLGTVDVVTCSYCLTMIPPWAQALDAMVALLADGGTLGLVDFTKRSDKPNAWSQLLNQWWFANDGVYFDEAHTTNLRSRDDMITTWFAEAEGNVPYTPLVATHYTWTGKKIPKGSAKPCEVFTPKYAPSAPDAPRYVR